MLETLIDNVKLKFFYLSVLWNYYAYTYSFFDNISHTEFVKKNGHSLLGLSSKVFTFDHLFVHRSDFFNNLAIFLGLNGQRAIKIDAWAEAQAV